MKAFFIVAVAATLATGALSSPAAAHAFLDHAAPAVGSTVHSPPAEVRLWFTQTLEPAFSTLRVFDAQKHQIDKADAHLDPKDASVLAVSLPPLAPGRYRVEWRVISTDTHVTQGDYTFDVAP